MHKEHYVLVIKDKACPLSGDCLIYSDNLGKLKAEGFENIMFDRNNVTAEIWTVKSGVKDRFMVNCNLLLESYEQ